MPPFVTFIALTAPEATVTLATQELPTPVRVVKPIPVNVPLVRPTPAVGLVNDPVPGCNGPPDVKTLALFPGCLISLPASNTVVVVPIPAETLLE